MWSRHSRRSVPTNLSANEFALGAPTGVLIPRVRLPVKTAPNASVNLLSRSRMMNLNRPVWSPRSSRRLRACWAVQVLGWVRGDARDVHGPGLDLHHEQHSVECSFVRDRPAESGRGGRDGRRSRGLVQQDSCGSSGWRKYVLCSARCC
jgi:hypothetical protein